MRTVFAVDGGGSKTDAALVREDGSVLGFARGPLSHPHHLGVPASADEIDALAAEVGAPADLAVLLLAGLDFPDEEEAYQAEAERRGWATEVVVGNDTYAVLRAGSDRGWGVAVTCGAGMNCVGVAADGRRVRFPSLGAVSGDQMDGGGAVGLAAVAAAARSEDGRGEKTQLERLVPEHFGLATPTELARAIHAGTIPWHRLGELSPLVFATAKTDAVAAGIVDRQAAEVVAFVRAAVNRLDLAGEDAEVVLGGGVLQAGNARLLDGIEAGLHEVGPRLSITVARSRPIVGAVLLGLDRLEAGPDAHARAREELDRATAALGGDVAGDATAVAELS
ncbi:MAG TPA: BadF/BadG/BcrA/BcrD ATPase family protein [Gaiellaceae bacterium]|nr:BadF/BadG/BcrA/BcrD ATPase family protein [Gaiellaceae bacterium]